MKRIIIVAVACIIALLLMGCTSVTTVTSTKSSLSQVPSTVLIGPMNQVNTTNPIHFDMTLSIISGSATVWVTKPSQEIVFPKTTYTSGTSTVSEEFSPVSGGGEWDYNVITSENASGDMTISLKQNQ